MITRIDDNINIVFPNLFLRFVTERVYQNNTVAIPHLIENIVTALRTHKHQDVVLKHLESASYFFLLVLLFFECPYQQIRYHQHLM